MRNAIDNRPESMRAVLSAVRGFLLVALAGCTGQIAERHLMATVDVKSGEVVNIFRVSVAGHTSMTNARYLAGYYDEKAVETFFNESKAASIDFNNLNALAGTAVPRFSPSCAEGATCPAPSAGSTKLAPLGSQAQGGAFVLILSTNPDAIASTIGAFADNDQNVQSAMYLFTRGDRDDVARIGATKATKGTDRSRLADELGQLLPTAAGTSDGQAQRTRYLSALRAVAAGLAPNSAPAFATIEEARQWFAAVPRREDR